MLIESVVSPSLDHDLLDPSRRLVLGRRARFEVRAAPGPCPLALAWLKTGLWHVQFLPVGTETELSVLVFPRRPPAETFFVRVPCLLRGVWLSAEDLDEVWRDQTHQTDVSRRFRTIAEQLLDRALGAWVRRVAVERSGRSIEGK
jgi:hypothetical protein